jgi:hypothetical protein
MTSTPPIFMKLRIPQQRSVETSCAKLHQTENVKNWAKIHLHHYISLHCPNSRALQGNLLFSISPKSVKKFANFWYEFTYTHMHNMILAQPNFKKHMLV